MDIEKLGKSSILSARCSSKIALVDLAGPVAWFKGRMLYYNNTLMGFKRKFIFHPRLSKANSYTCAVSENKTGRFDIAIAIIYARGISALHYL